MHALTSIITIISHDIYQPYHYQLFPTEVQVQSGQHPGERQVQRHGPLPHVKLHHLKRLAGRLQGSRGTQTLLTQLPI